VTQPLIDLRNADAPRSSRSRPHQGLVAVTLVGMLALLFFLGFSDFGANPTALLIVLGGFAALGIAALLALVLGFLQIAGRAPPPSWADQFMDEDVQGVLSTNSQGQIVYANGAYGALTGVDDPQMIRLPDRVFGTEADAADTMFQLLRTVAEGKVGEADVRLARGAGGQGAPRWYHVTARPLPEDGSPLADVADTETPYGVVWRIADVTDERARQEQVFQDLQQAVDYLDHAPAGFFSSDPEGTINYMNATLAAWLGYDLAMIDQTGLTLNELLAGDGAALLAAAPTTTDFDGLATIIDVDLVRRDGARLPVRIHHRVPISVDGSPRASRTLVINRSSGFDVDESVRAAEVKFARFFNNAPIAIAVVNSDGALVQMNAPFASLFPEEASDGASLSAHDEAAPSAAKLVDLFSDEARDAVQRALNDAAAQRGRMRPVDVVIGKTPEKSEQPGMPDLGHQISAQLFVSAVGDGADTEALVFLIDTTEQKALEQQFAQTQKMMAFGQLAGGVAHDFNNMLQAIMGNVDLLMLNHPPSDPSYRYISPIRQNCNRAAALVRHLLAFSRKQTLRPQVMHMDDVLSDLSMTVDRLVGETVKLDVDIAGDVWPVMADLTQLENVLINLAVNARDAMPEGGKLTMTTRNVMREECATFKYKGLEAADYVLVSVTDTGTGIEPEIMSKIFEPFFTTKDVGKGTGLGLATVYGTIKQTGGYVYPESTVGEGTSFHIFLPRYVGSEVAAVQAAQSQNQPQEDLTGAASVLLVEDDEGVRMVNATLLRSGGYTVHEADSGVEALEVLEEFGDEIQLIVSDVVMPEMDGPTLLNEARALYPDMRFIFVSGYAEDAFAKNLPDDQEFTFLAKPFSMKDFAETVKRVLAS
jgi:two-component system, cell cycle sensor histidine kinase and response regulator CckA